jgi:glycosyltransferase involved in cell wall biosynthesis
VAQAQAQPTTTSITSMASDGGPAIAVAVPTCNGARHLADALRSILAQTIPPAQLIVCDDRSDDDTLAIVREVAGDRAQIHINTERLGLAGNWNACVARTTSPWVAVFHQDDVLAPDHLAHHRAAIQDRPDLGLVVSAAHHIGDDGRPVWTGIESRPTLETTDRVFEPGFLVAKLAASNPIRCSAVTLARQAHSAVGGFRTDLRYALDWAFWLAVGRVFPVAWHARPTVAVRWHERSETHRFRTGTIDLDEQRAVTDEALDLLAHHNPQALAEQTRTRDRRLARAYLNRAYSAACDGNRRLEARCLRSALTLSPSTTSSTLLRDPRLMGRLLLGRRSIVNQPP